MARRPDLETFARQHGLKIGTIADLIRYRLEKERSVERIAERDIDTEFGPFRLYCYEDHVNSTVHLALVRGDLDAQQAAARARAPRGHDARSRRRARRRAQLVAARRDAAHRARGLRASSCCCVRTRAPLEIAEAVRARGAPRPSAIARRRRARAAHVRHRRADPARPRRDAHARAERAEADARPVGVRSRSRRIRG